MCNGCTNCKCLKQCDICGKEFNVKEGGGRIVESARCDIPMCNECLDDWRTQYLSWKSRQG